MNETPVEATYNYKEHVRQRIEALMPVLARATIGDYSQDVPITDEQDEFSELYVGIQVMVDTIREKLHQLQIFNDDLEDMINTRSAELFGSEMRFRAVTESANDAIITVDDRGKIAYLNPAAEIIFGCSLSAVQGRTLKRLIPDLDSSLLTSTPLPGTASRRLAKLVKATARRHDGHKFPVEVSFAAWKSGPKTFTTAIIRDLTEHQLLLDRLANQAAKLEGLVAAQTEQLRLRLTEAEQTRAEDEALLRSLGEGVIATDKTGRIFFANAEFARLTGTTLNQLKGRSYTTLLPLVDQSGHAVPKTQRPMSRALRTGRRISTSDYLYRASAGQLIPVAITASPITLKGRIIGGLDVIRDITKEKEAEQLKSEFVSLASHQLRTPATAVKGLISILLDGYNGPLADNQLHTLQQAFSENEHELKIIDDMLDVAKLDAGEVVLEKTSVDLSQLIQSVIQEQHELVRTRRQAVKTSLPPSINVHADPGKLQMVFDNLVANASKYTPEGGHITITLEQVGNRILVHIQDNGIGIAAKDLHHLFKRFSRAANAAKTHTSGSGLGLYLAKKIMDLHRGRIDVVSELGQGSTFTVMIPK